MAKKLNLILALLLVLSLWYPSVVFADPQEGLILIAPLPIEDLSNVNTTGIADNSTLEYNATSGQWEIGTDAGASGGEANTASSSGSGVSVYYQKTGVNLEFNAIESKTDDITAALNATSHNIGLTFVPGNVASSELSDTADILYETELDVESELEAQLGDVSNVFTNNDGALNDDNVTLADVQAACSSDFHNIGGTDDDVPDAGDFGAATDLDANGAVTWGNITEGELADNTTTGDDIKANTIDSKNYVAGSIDDEHLASGINATKIADGTVTNAEFQYINSLSSNAQDQIDGKQPLEATLTDISDGTIAENLVNTANPWADDEIANDITLTNISQITTKPITSLSATNWRIFYSADGAVPVELELGANGTYLRSNGASVAPTFTTPSGAGDVVGPASNTDNYVPQWDGTDSKALKNGFAITDAGKALVDDANNTVQRTTLGLGSAATRDAEDSLTDGANLPDGAAIVEYCETTQDYLKTTEAQANISGAPHHFIGTVIDPHTLYATDHEICIWGAADANITITSIKITCDADPATELDIDLKWADAFIGLANATVIDVCDTTNGITSISSGFDDATIPSGKCIYWSFGADPIAAITQFNFDITWDYD